MKNIAELVKEIVLQGIDPKKVLGYEMDDYLHDCPYFIREFEGRWQVFHWERGQIFDLKEFSTESDAVMFTYSDIKRVIIHRPHNANWYKDYGLEN